MRYFFSASMLLSVIRNRAKDRTWDDIADGISPERIGRTLTQLRITKDRQNQARFYTITLPELERLLDAYRLHLPPLLTIFRRFNQELLLASLPPGSPGAPLQPPSPGLIPLIARLLKPDQP